jgi:hypothetical protein
MQPLREDRFPGPAFADEEDGYICWGDFAQYALERLHRRADAPDKATIFTHQ